ncbi:unnamed protein product [Calypogeia fissa]
MSSKKLCKYCLDVDPTVVRSWHIGHHSLEISGCKSCHARHEKQVTDLEAELTTLRAAFARRKADHEIELSRKEEASSRSLMLKEVNFRQLLLQVNKLTAEVRHQRRKSNFLQLDCEFILPGNVMLYKDDIKFYPLVRKDLKFSYTVHLPVNVDDNNCCFLLFRSRCRSGPWVSMFVCSPERIK